MKRSNVIISTMFSFTCTLIATGIVPVELTGKSNINSVHAQSDYWKEMIRDLMDASSKSNDDWGRIPSNSNIKYAIPDNDHIEWDQAAKECEARGGKLEWYNNLKTCFKK